VPQKTLKTLLTLAFASELLAACSKTDRHDCKQIRKPKGRMSNAK